jgi:pyruvate/2-oxoglutarate/acetoin dehydrogenase E1 component
MKCIAKALNEALFDLMDLHEDVLVIGEDILDPYGGAFQITKGLSTTFPDRVIGTPISEAAIVGLGIGLALKGYRPVVEIMFGDFMALVADQLINQASKIPWMYNQQIPLPLVVRTPMGGRRGYGPTHSQSLERLFLGLPGLVTVAVSPLHDPKDLLRAAVEDLDLPVLFIENKSLYPRPVLSRDALKKWGFTAIEHNDGPFPTYVLSQTGSPDIVIIAYGGMLPVALEAAGRLQTCEELNCRIVAPHQLSPLRPEPMVTSARAARRTVVVEEGIVSWGWGAEVAAALAGVRHEAPLERVGAVSLPIPAGRAMEDQVLPGVDDIVAAAVRTVENDFL